MRFRILGSVEVWHDGRQVAVGGPQQRALLALLLLSANRVVPVDRLIAALWAERPPPDARGLVQSCVARLRRVLPADDAPGQPLLTRSPGYMLRVGPGELDLDRFEELVAAAGRLVATDTPEALERASALLGEGLALWRGPALSDVDLDASKAAAAGLEERRLAALEDRIEVEVRLGRHGHLVGELRAHVAAYPLRERLRALLMVSLYRGGRQAEALAVYADTRRLLVDELGIEPGPQLQRLHQAILANRDVAAVDTVDPGPARRAAAPVPRQLPPPVRHFAGRAAELQALTGLLDEGTDGGTVVISAIAGTAGIGKTALAVQWAHRVADRFPDGQLYVDLRGIDPAGSVVGPAEAIGVFLDALDVPPERIPVDLAARTALYRSALAGKRVLVVLDNARDTEQVRPLLPGSPGCLAVVTSRNQLSSLVITHGAHPITLDVLSEADARSLIAHRIGQRRVEAEPDAVTEIINRCAGLPLALAITASRATLHPRFPLTALADELRHTAGGLDAFTDPDAAADIRAVFSCSYQTLSAEAARLFRLLALNPAADISTPAGASLAGTPLARIRPPLAELTHAHLVTERAPGRFTFHDLLRDYAAEHARASDTKDEREAAVRRLLDWYLYTTDAAARLLYPHTVRLPPRAVEPPTAPLNLADRTEALAWLDAERPNLLAIIRHAARNGPRSAAWLLADALRAYFMARMHTTDWLAIADVGLAAARADGDLRAQAAALLSLGDAHQRLSRYAPAVNRYTQALDLARRVGWTAGEATVLGNLGNVYWPLGRLREAADRYTKALVLYRQAGDIAGQARSLGSLGLALRHLGRLPDAADHYLQAVPLFHRIGSRSYEAVALGNLGEVYHNLGRLDLAVEHLVRALNLYRETGDRGGEADTLRVLAAVHRDTGDHRHALALSTAALNLARDTGDRRVEANALNTRAAIEQRLGQHRSARDGHQDARELARRTDNSYPQVEALIGLVAAHRHLGEADRARECADEALAISRHIGYRVLEGQALTALAAVDLDEDRPDPAAELARQALDIHRDTGHRYGSAHAQLLLGHALRRTDQPRAAATRWHHALDLFTDIGTPEVDALRTLLAQLGPDTVGLAAPPHPTD